MAEVENKWVKEKLKSILVEEKMYRFWRKMASLGLENFSRKVRKFMENILQ